MSHVKMMEARLVCPGMVFSTDGYTVESVIHDRSYVTIRCVKNGHTKEATFHEYVELPIWVED